MKKKRIWTAAAVGILAIFFTGCSSEKYFQVTDASKIELTSGTNGSVVEITDIDSMNHITDNIAAIAFGKQESGENSTGWRYWIKWYNSENKLMEEIVVMNENMIKNKNYIYHSMKADDEIDLSFLDGLFNNSDKAAPRLSDEEDTILKKPPVLTVVCDDQSVEALQGTFSWTYENGDGTSTGMMADSMHPLQAKEYMPSFDLSSADILSDPIKAYLQWETVPDRVSVHCWGEANWGRTDAESEAVPVELLENDFVMEWRDGNRIYEVVAEWNRSEVYGGVAFYSFYTIR